MIVRCDIISCLLPLLRFFFFFFLLLFLFSPSSSSSSSSLAPPRLEGLHNLTLPLNVKQCSRVRQCEVAEIRDLLPVPNSRSGLLRYRRIRSIRGFFRPPPPLMIHSGIEREWIDDERSFSRRDISNQPIRDKRAERLSSVAARCGGHDRWFLVSVPSIRLIRTD